MTLNLYESAQLQRITGPTIHPGGFFLTEKAIHLCHPKAGAKILDVGCGVGATVDYLKTNHHLNAFGLDLSSTLLHQAHEKNADLALIRGNADALPIPNGALQGLFCECVLSLTSEPLAVLKEFFRVLESGGFLVITDIYWRNRIQPVPSLSFNSCLRGAVSAGQTREMAANAGFTILSWEDHSNLLKQLAARIVWEYGSMNQFWSSFCGKAESVRLESDITQLRPGYYLLAARKESDNG